MPLLRPDPPSHCGRGKRRAARVVKRGVQLRHSTESVRREPKKSCLAVGLTTPLDHPCGHKLRPPPRWMLCDPQTDLDSIWGAIFGAIWVRCRSEAE